MSHYIVNVFLPPSAAGNVAAAIEQALAPFDENTSVEPYRDYEKGTPQEHWAYSCVLQDGYLRTNELGGEIGWFDYVVAYNQCSLEKWYDGDVETYEEEGEALQYEPETDRAYTVSTYNPRSKWDWYQIGGRWVDRYPIKTEYQSSPLLIGGTAAFGVERDPLKFRNADGGPLYTIDWGRMRQMRMDEVTPVWDLHEALVREQGRPTPWKDVLASVDGDVEKAREIYHEQSYLKARARLMQDHRDDKVTQALFWGEPEEYDFPNKGEFLEHTGFAAIAGFASLTPQGEWVEPGKMGWFGMSTDDDETRAEYRKWFNNYVTEADQDTIIVAVDCHI